MTDDTVWTGTSSQAKNFGVYLLCGLLCFLVLPLFYALWAWLVLKNRVFKLTSERLLTTEGVFSKSTEALELYRVRDIRVKQPFWLRLWGLENIELDTTDQSDRLVMIDYVPASIELSTKIRDLVEACRQAKRVREIDVE